MINSILLLASTRTETSRLAEHLLKAHGADLQSHYCSTWGKPLPEDLQHWRGDLIVSYCSRWIVPHWLLERATLAINFHPAPPNYPGIGGTNFALYHGDPLFGVTAHHMAAKVDAGAIIAVDRFEMLQTDTVGTLHDRTHVHLFALFSRLMPPILRGARCPETDERWNNRCFTRADLDALATITPLMPPAEIEARVRATSYGSWRPHMQIGERRYRLEAAP